MSKGLPFSQKTVDGLTIYYSDKKGTDRLIQDGNNWYLVTVYVIAKVSVEEVRYLLADWKLNH